MSNTNCCVPGCINSAVNIFDLQELADFEKMPDGPKLSVKELERDCFDACPALFRCTVGAEAETGRVVGYAVYFPTYSTWAGAALMLEDLCVRQHARRRGLGTSLFRAVAQEAARVGSRLDFHVLAWNPARALYARCGAADLTADEHWRYYRLAGDRLAHFANMSRDGHADEPPAEES